MYLLVQGRQFAAPLRCRPPASGVSGGGCYATVPLYFLRVTLLWVHSPHAYFETKGISHSKNFGKIVTRIARRCFDQSPLLPWLPLRPIYVLYYAPLERFAFGQAMSGNHGLSRFSGFVALFCLTLRPIFFIFTKISLWGGNCRFAVARLRRSFFARRCLRPAAWPAARIGLNSQHEVRRAMRVSNF